MDPIEKMERKRQARQRLHAQRQRAIQLRNRVVAISVIAFVLLWTVVFAQMATGNDPVLGERSVAATAPKTASDESETSAPGEVIEPEPVEEEPIEVELVPEPAPVTTSQS